MGFLSDIGLGAAEPGTLTSLFDPGDLAGTDRARRAKEASKKAEAQQLAELQLAMDELRRATGEAQGFLEPFAGVGQQGLDLAGFLTDPQQQTDFLRSNPLFQLSLDRLDNQTERGASAAGRLSSGDTLERLSENTLLAAQPLIADQKSSIIDLLNFGSGTSRAQANAALGLGSDISNLIQDRGNILSSGTLGRNQIIADTTANQNQLAAQIFGAFSDPKLKKDEKVIGEKNGFKLWSWNWNEKANELGLYGSSEGVMADEVVKKSPEAVSIKDGYMMVDYGLIGV